MTAIKIHFLGAAETVTGSKFYIETPQQNILIDCGMFQGIKKLRSLNWDPLPIDVSQIDIVLLTHGHLDHTGYLPRLVQQGFAGDIIGTSPTLAITEIILKDSAKIHEEEAEKANKEGYSIHEVALPFYTIKQAEQTIQRFKNKKEGEWYDLSTDIRYRFNYNGHILGATFIELEINGKVLVFSGDVGRKNDKLLRNPKKPQWADYLFLESTYGNKCHPEENIEEKLIYLIKETIQNGGTLIIPSFAVERLQTLMYILWTLYKRNKIPNIPIYVDSPMGNSVISVFERFSEWHKISLPELRNIFEHINIVTSYRETWEVIDNPAPKIVIAGSGMVTGGRVLTYLKQLIDNQNTSVLLVGYQAEGTRGRQLQEGAHEIKIFGKYIPVRAGIFYDQSLSAHADQSELLDWTNEIKNIPEQVFLIHGEATALDSLRVKIKDVYSWRVKIPNHNEVVNL
ncbi:MBL fold metallo-hydrolase RNA specificity domain-containing protein [Aquimarina intermedia]|uniref:Metallo-beta-lactamase family protein n=1 Tax=Aquimarina intermedia TaxID=350814 RepID=A0A5S5C701_9FLAO|nr:MBL fold metallo-hydrolase [Aquimarina intermedia]TYP74252.1 metallo-beta-lactamase family protein [Aquimarina intermedia]